MVDSSSSSDVSATESTNVRTQAPNVANERSKETPIPKQSANPAQQQVVKADNLGMSPLAAALPSDTGRGYPQSPTTSGQGNTSQSHTYQVSQHTGHLPAYPGYIHGHIANVPQYHLYMNEHGMNVPYNSAHAQFSHPQMYAGHPASPLYGSFPQGYGMPAHIQHPYHGQPPLYANQEYTQMHQRPAGSHAALSPSPDTPSSPSVPSAPRGPPRKPKQSGHALWVGNLPPATQIRDLKDHFAREAANDIESVFLISKSNCAFVNYRSESACNAAMTRFHDSRFQGLRLVCRLRKSPSSASTTGGSTSPAPDGTDSAQSGPSQPQTAIDTIIQNRESSARAMESVGVHEVPVSDKYFVVKSLTVEDLDLSVQNGIWATQSHNEEALNKAYSMVENVFLIFSANKSGEYFGYARMDSPINDETAKYLEWKPYESTRSPDQIAEADLPRSIPTPATEYAPKGRIIDDSARGTIFWEADTDSELDNDTDDETEYSDPEADNKSTPDPTVDSAESEQQTFGRPFRVKWISTVRLPFYRTRGLRNPWNSNREVKIARDGTELETSVGRRLIALFHRVPTPQQMLPTHPHGQQAYLGHFQSPMGFGVPPPMAPGGRF